MQKEHTLIVKVCDQDEPQLCTSVPVVVSIEDRNDNPPVFKNQHYKFEVRSDVVGVLCRSLITPPEFDDFFNYCLLNLSKTKDC